jgi:DNA polymerase-1
LSSYVGDIEADGLLDTITKVHCIVLYEIETDKYLRFNDQPHPYVKHGSIADSIELMNKADRLYFHYGHGYDYLALKLLYPSFMPKATALYDTHTMARAVFRDIKSIDFKAVRTGKRHPDFMKMQLLGTHKLKAWGYRLGVLKSSIADDTGETDWSEWTPEMEDYCVQDVIVTVRLLDFLTTDTLLLRHPWECHALDNHFQHIMSRQERQGFAFNEGAANEMYADLQSQLKTIEKELRDVIRPFYKRGAIFTPKRDNTKSGYVAGRSLSKIDLTEFKPSSRDHIQDRLQQLYGWKPTAYGNDGKASVDESVLSSLPYPLIPKLLNFLVLSKTIGQLATGKLAWLKFVRDGRIHGRIDAMGCITWRCSHSKPNLGQVPSVATYDPSHAKSGTPIYGIKGKFGADCRSLFTVPDGHTLCGHDGSGLELRCLGHYMAKYDGGDYSREVVDGDVHTVNQRAIGLRERKSSKVWIYAYLYGSGDGLLGKITLADMTPEDQRAFFDEHGHSGEKLEKALASLGRKGRSSIADKIPALGKLIADVKKKAKAQGQLRAIDGRVIKIRAAHSALNAVLQSAGAIIMKRWLVILDQDMQDAGYLPYQWVARGEAATASYEFVANVHDEAQTEVKDIAVDAYHKAAVEAFPKAGDYYKFRAPITGEGKCGRVWTDTH